MKLSVEQVRPLLDTAQSLRGQQASFSEFISRSRDIGAHNRYFATQTRFAMATEDVRCFFNGAQL